MTPALPHPSPSEHHHHHGGATHHDGDMSLETSSNASASMRSGGGGLSGVGPEDSLLDESDVVSSSPAGVAFRQSSFPGQTPDSSRLRSGGGGGGRGSAVGANQGDADVAGEWEDWDPEKARSDLRTAIRVLSRRGLKLSAKWAGEQLVGLALPHPVPASAARSPNGDDDPTGAAAHPQCSSSGRWGLVDDDEEEDDLCLYAKTLFDAGEYERAASFLSVPLSVAKSDVVGGLGLRGGGAASASGGDDLATTPPLADLSPYGIYLRAYALYLAGERRKEEEVVELREPLERTALRNTNLPQLSSELYDSYSSNRLDAFGLYIYGVVLKELSKPYSSTLGVGSQKSHASGGNDRPSAQSMLMESILAYPFNWSAWLDLAELCIADPSIHPEVESTLQPIASHWTYHFFCVHVFLENQANDNAVAVIERLVHGTSSPPSPGDGLPLQPPRPMFLQSPHLQSSLATAHYNARDFDTAASHFQSLTLREPYRLDCLDVYSNILYVREDKVNLSKLAHRAARVEKYRPETCCIIGNYYSLRGRHEKAVTYFQRAIKLDRTYLSAWTLMGHEYVEMKNTAAAVEAYRRAVDVSEGRDYRAWYGLGQTYEIMNMPLYALFYYRKAAGLRPYDPRMWTAMGGCHLSLNRRSDAMRSYERAVSNRDGEGVATRKLAALYREDGDTEGAARCYLRHLELRYQGTRGALPSPSESSFAGPNPVGGATLEDVVNAIQIDVPEAEALLYLSYYHRDNGEYETAAMCCSRLLEYPGPEKEEGKALLREIRSRMDQRGDGGNNDPGRGERAGVVLRTGTNTPGSASRGTYDESMDESSREDRGGGESSFEFSP